MNHLKSLRKWKGSEVAVIASENVNKLEKHAERMRRIEKVEVCPSCACCARTISPSISGADFDSKGDQAVVERFRNLGCEFIVSHS